MKKRITSIFLTLVLTLCLVGTAFADTTFGTTVETKDIGKNVTATLETADDNTQYINLTVEGLTSGGQYLVLMVAGEVTDLSKFQITESTIKYIDQASAQASPEGTVEFKVYPSTMQDSTILLSGTDLDLTIVATVTVPYTLGDANNDGKVNISDVSSIARHVAKSITLTGNRLLAADVTKDGKVTISDVTKIARFVAKSITTLE